MILVTTSDYYPQLGGLATFTVNMEKILKDFNLEYEVFHWKKFQEINQFDQSKLSKFSLIINIHSQFCWQSGIYHPKMINFVHGSEALITSPNFFKKLYKIFNKKIYYNRLEKSYFNVFISEATLKKTIANGYKSDYSRDLIIHNCIDLTDAKFTEKKIDDKTLVFSCIVRDVPHKNLQGSVKFCELLKKVTNKNIELIVPQKTNIHSETILITKLGSENNTSRNEAYQRSHFNLLLSKDHSNIGFYEGFGLTVLEAAKFGTPSVVFSSGGLPEAVHHLKTGWVISEISEKAVNSFVNTLNNAAYGKMSNDCFTHTMSSHSLNEYGKLIKILLKTSEAA